ncbi:MAG: hypothetical protein HY811_05625 [Planctomycetes bacterium]|nr:hypothetical protein [Planctomycetota bacterium]
MFYKNTFSHALGILLCIVACLAAPVFAEDADSFANIKVNDHIRITPKTGSQISGIVKVITKEKITLDVSYDDPDFDGNISVYKNNIQKIETLDSLTDKEKEQIEKEKTERLEKTWREDEPVVQPVQSKETTIKEGTPPEVPEKTEEEKEREKLMAILKKFNPDEGWSEDRKTDILEKMESYRSADEKEFLKVYDDWLKSLELKAVLDRRALVEKFPPDKWNEQRYDEIISRFIRLKVVPSQEEREFADKFKEWEKGVEEKKKEDEEAKKKEEAEKSKRKTEPTPAPAEESQKK